MATPAVCGNCGGKCQVFPSASHFARRAGGYGTGYFTCNICRRDSSGVVHHCLNCQDPATANGWDVCAACYAREHRDAASACSSGRHTVKMYESPRLFAGPLLTTSLYAAGAYNCDGCGVRCEGRTFHCM